MEQSLNRLIEQHQDAFRAAKESGNNYTANYLLGRLEVYKDWLKSVQ